MYFWHECIIIPLYHIIIDIFFRLLIYNDFVHIQDGFVLVGSVAGQRYWSSMLSLESTITCGIWTPDDQQVYFGTTSGRLIVMDVHGAMVSQVQLAPDHGPITAMAWSCEKFKMEESDEGAAAAAASDHHISTGNGLLLYFSGIDDKFNDIDGRHYERVTTLVEKLNKIGVLIVFQLYLLVCRVLFLVQNI
jgi:hypothetical protein